MDYPSSESITSAIVRGDLANYRRIARTGDVETLRVLVLVMAEDLEEALEAACPTTPATHNRAT